MFGLLSLIAKIWDGLAPLVAWCKTNFPKLFNRVWAAGLIIVGLAWTVITHAKVFLGQAADAVDKYVFPTIHPGQINNTTVRQVLEIANYIFPVAECFGFLLAYVSLWVFLICMRWLLKLAGHLW